MFGIKVHKKDAQKVIKKLRKKSLISKDYKIKRDDNFVYIPIKKIPGNLNYEIVDIEFEKIKKEPRSFIDLLEGKLKKEEIKKIKKSFDIIGDIVIIEVPEELEKYKKLIGKAVLEFTKRKAVYMKKSKIKGIKRIRDLEHLAGEKISETIHQEYGTRIMLDVKKVYFSPRLATERERVASQVKDGEVVVDAFAGVGPFSLAIARKKKAKKIYAIDINPDAIHYLKKNIKLNKAYEIIPIQGDTREVLEDLKIKYDRIIMNLPAKAHEFLDVALKFLKKGGVIHYYEFSKNFDTPINRIKEYAPNVKILNKRKVKSKSPGVWHIAIDAKIL